MSKKSDRAASEIIDVIEHMCKTLTGEEYDEVLAGVADHIEVAQAARNDDKKRQKE